MEKVKKILSIILVNIIIIIGVLAILDYGIYIKFKYQGIKLPKEVGYIESYKVPPAQNTYLYLENINKHLEDFRIYTREKYHNKKSILIFGCSYAYGCRLKMKECFHYKLQEKLKRNVYNFGICACGIQHMLTLLQNKLIFSIVKEEPSDIIYIYIPPHIERLNYNIFSPLLISNGFNVRYKLKNDKLVYNNNKPNVLSQLYLVKALYKYLDHNFVKYYVYTDKIKKENAKLAYKTFLESKKEIEKLYPNIRFTILRYQSNKDKEEILENPQMWIELEKSGFNIVKTSDLIGRKFNFNSVDTVKGDGFHPSEAAWDLLLDPFIKELNL